MDRSDRLEALKALDAAGRLRVRVNAYLPVNNDAAERLGVWFGQYAQGQVLGPRLRIGGVKLFVDPCNTYQAFVSVPYRDRPGYYGEAFWTQQELNAIVEQLAAGGWQIASHVGGDRGLDMILTAYQAVLPGPDNGRRFRIEHLTIVRDDQIPVLKQLGILGVIQYEWGTSRDVPKIDRLPTPLLLGYPLARPAGSGRAARRQHGHPGDDQTRGELHHLCDGGHRSGRHPRQRRGRLR